MLAAYLRTGYARHACLAMNIARIGALATTEIRYHAECTLERWERQHSDIFWRSISPLWRLGNN